MPTLETIIKDYNYLKNKVLATKLTDNLELTLCEIELLANIAYTFNFIYFDEEIEKKLNQISNFVIEKASLHDEAPNDKIVFYDCFAFDNRGLTQQYIRALKSWNVPFLFVFENGRDIQKSKKILDELSATPNATVLIPPASLTRIERAIYIHREVSKYQPGKVFLHMSPWDTVGNIVWNAYSNGTRYQVNLTDHAFWLGTNICDYVIDFRSYGFNVTTKFRNIPDEKVLIQPYYPIKSEETFMGLPNATNGKVVLFTGGTYYKMYGDNSRFFKMIKNILDHHSNTILLIAGGGTAEPLKKFIAENSFSERIMLLGNRKDINEIFQHIDIYIPTYPITGCLMGQFAAANGKNIVGYTDADLPINHFEELIDTPNEIVFTNLGEFYAAIDKLINDDDARKAGEDLLKNSVLEEENFNAQLKDLTNNNRNSKYIPDKYTISRAKFTSIYLEAENKYLKAYSSLFYHSYKTNIKHTPIVFYKYVAGFIIKKLWSMITKKFSQ